MSDSRTLNPNFFEPSSNNFGLHDLALLRAEGGALKNPQNARATWQNQSPAFFSQVAGVSQNKGYHFGDPSKQDYSIWESIFGGPPI